MAIAQKKLLGESLVEKELITEEQLRQAELEAKADAKPLRKIKGLISEKDVTVFLSQEFDLPLVDLTNYLIDFISYVASLNPDVQTPPIDDVDWDSLKLIFWPRIYTDEEKAEPDIVLISNKWILVAEVKPQSGIGDSQPWREYVVGRKIAEDNAMSQDSVCYLVAARNHPDIATMFKPTEVQKLNKKNSGLVGRYSLWCKDCYGLHEPANCTQICTKGVRFAYGHASASIISFYLTSINHLFRITYKHEFRTSNPKVAGLSPAGRVLIKSQLPIYMALLMSPYGLKLNLLPKIFPVFIIVASILLCRAKKPSYNIFAHSSGRLHKSIREKTVVPMYRDGLCACWQRINR